MIGMDPTPINELLESDPFTPFRLKLSNQEVIVIDVTNPGLVVVTKRHMFIANPDREGFHLYSLMHVVGLELIEEAA